MLGSVRVTRHVYEVDGWGVGELWIRDGVVVQHELASPELQHLASEVGDRAQAARVRATPGPAPHTGGPGPPLGTLPAEMPRVCAGLAPGLCRRFALHLRGEAVGYDDVTVELAWATPFQQALCTALRAVPWGELVSYGELAALAGRPGAARAAGSFCAESRFALIVPCHRVVAANGIGSYGESGVALKRRLLALEGVSL
jgi:O-6-methylguanine DNA methyltransferase